MVRIDYPYLTVRGHPRLFAGLALGILVAFLLPSDFRVATRLLIAWNIGTWLYFILSAVLVVTSTPESMRRRAKASDEGRFLVLVLTSLAAIASMGAIVAQLGATKDMSGMTKSLHVTLAAATIISAWTFIHLTYALHYAHEYFDELDAEPGKEPHEAGGLKFPGTDDPDYFDFLYFSFIIGVASQTADVEITAKEMRRVSLLHSILSFFFNSAVLAITINIAAGLI
ncbi:conserved membrane hypothetical protein [Methylocella tundrae]|uniref:DUF1345 domain-containing protein n=1 Tax=Methylocella tundrae TaxID=227605 RepID=A0A8B6M4F3_METTU|nr:DUF1345 domain-containing protein [Methylocella tundrae]VTZ27929.1 conserved membrane hypothetical protein [Methylocella tundrae]VTZ49887.1 conserved membrane hypothetical protein [Methylocella tundrae]